MTLWVARDGQKVTIHGNINLDVNVRNSGVVDYQINEDASHVRSFWASLGRALDEAEAEQKTGDA